jgi:hypothetical protein
MSWWPSATGKNHEQDVTRQIERSLLRSWCFLLIPCSPPASTRFGSGLRLFGVSMFVRSLASLNSFTAFPLILRIRRY